jgi:cytochrome c-type biogenesis protein CcmH/NrfG
VDEALAWIGRSKPGGRVFAWIHLFEPHAPYEADAGAASKPVGDRTVGDRPVSDRPISERPVSERPVSDRYDDEIARADAQVARVVQALAPRAASTLFVVAADHGEAFGEHGEIGHSIFVYDTTLRVPLIIAGPGMSAAGASSGGAIAGSGDGTGAGAGRSAGGDSGIGRVAPEPVSLVDVVPTLVDLLGLAPIETDGVSLRPALAGQTVGRRALYAESLAPLLDFGWSPLRSMREGSDKYIAAPKPELYDVAGDPGETRNRLGQTTATAGAAAASTAIVKTLADRIERINAAAAPVAASAATAPAAAVSSAPQGDGSRRSQTPAGALPTTPSPAAGSQADREALARLQSLGYVGSSTGVGVRDAAGDAARPDPKDRIAIAARIADVTSGELQGAALRAALERLVRDDPRNGQMQMRLGFVLLDAGDCRAAIPRFQAAIAAAVPSADPYLGLAECLGPSGNHTAARNALATADRIEPNNPVVAANLGLLALDEGRTQDAIDRLRAALTRAPDLHQARFALARAYGRAGQRADAAREARELLTRLPANAPQRSEVERLLAAVQ